jgi:hypothetical protein
VCVFLWGKGGVRVVFTHTYTHTHTHTVTSIFLNVC